MHTRRTFLMQAPLAGIAGILAARTAPAFAQTLNTFRIGQVGLGSHSFLLSLMNRPPISPARLRSSPPRLGTIIPNREVMARAATASLPSLEPLVKTTTAPCGARRLRRVLEYSRPRSKRQAGVHQPPVHRVQSPTPRNHTAREIVKRPVHRRILAGVPAGADDIGSSPPKRAASAIRGVLSGTAFPLAFPACHQHPTRRLLRHRHPPTSPATKYVA